MAENPLKILYTASTTGHLRSFHLPYLRALSEAGHRVTAAGAGSGEGLPEGVSHLPVPFTKSFFSADNFRASRLLARSIRSERYDLVLTHTSLAAFFTRLGVMLAGKRDTRVVNTVHGYLFDEASPRLRRTVLLWAEKLTAGVTDDILTMNEADARIARTYHLCRGSVIPIHGMGVPAEELAPAGEAEKAAARAELGLPSDAFVLLYAAEFSPRKNQSFLLDVLPLLPENVILMLPGQGEKREECMAKAETMGLGQRVRFPGFVSSTLPLLRAADICVSSSRSEGLPFHVMEAMFCGLPAVLTRVKGHEDLLPTEAMGRLYPFGDVTAAADAIRYYAQNREECTKAGEKAREFVQKYALDRVQPEVLCGYFGQKNTPLPGR